MTNSNQLLIKDDTESSNSSAQFNSDSMASSGGNGFSKIAIGALIGATLGGLAAALANQKTADQINQAIRGVGKFAKDAANGLDENAKQVGNTVNGIATTVNETAKEVGQSVGSNVVNVSSTVQNTVSTVKGTAGGLKTAVKAAVGAVQGVTNSTPSASEPTVSAVNGEKLYRLVPVEPGQAVE